MINLLYNLKERLEICGIANINLLHQDFRLKKAIDDFEQLISISPVLDKIHKDSIKLLDYSNNKPKDLLDLLGLINAVIVTQLDSDIMVDIDSDIDSNIDSNIDSGVSNSNMYNNSIIKDAIYIPDISIYGSYECQYKNISSKIINNFYDAIYKKGAGRVEILKNILSNKEILNDFRIVTGMLEGLNDSFYEVKDLMIQKLSELDKSFIVVLKSILKDGYLNTKKLSNTKKLEIYNIIANISNNKETGEEDLFFIDILNNKNLKNNEMHRNILYLLSDSHMTAKNILSQIDVKNIFNESIISYNNINEGSITEKLKRISIKLNYNYLNELDYILLDKDLDYSSNNKNNINKIIYMSELYALSSSKKICNKILGMLDNIDETDTKKDIKNQNLSRLIMLYFTTSKPCKEWFDYIISLLDNNDNNKDLLISDKNIYKKDIELVWIYDIIIDFLLLNKLNKNILDNNKELDDFISCICALDSNFNFLYGFLLDIINLNFKDINLKYADEELNNKLNINKLNIKLILDRIDFDSYEVEPNLYRILNINKDSNQERNISKIYKVYKVYTRISIDNELDIKEFKNLFNNNNKDHMELERKLIIKGRELIKIKKDYDKIIYFKDNKSKDDLIGFKINKNIVAIKDLDWITNILAKNKESKKNKTKCEYPDCQKGYLLEL